MNQIGIIATIDGGLRVHYIGRADLLANKEAADRPQDRLDASYLRDTN